jgi:hypothetical protein
MLNWYDLLNPSTQLRDLGPDGDIRRITLSSSGMDAFLVEIPEAPDVSLHDLFIDRRASQVPTETRKISGAHDLQGFSRIASDTLIRHSGRDLWKLREGEDGDFYIDRLFDDNGEPLKA